MYRVGIITASDKGSQGLREDISGPTINEMISKYDTFKVEIYTVIPDDKELIKKTLIQMADIDEMNLILTTGGTGFSHRDVTPEATLEVIERKVPGIPEAMRNFSLKITPRAMLSRSEAGLRGNTLIINLPGSPKAITEVLDYIIPSVIHGLDILTGTDSECGNINTAKNI